MAVRATKAGLQLANAGTLSHPECDKQQAKQQNNGRSAELTLPEMNDIDRERHDFFNLVALVRDGTFTLACHSWTIVTKIY